MAKGKDKKKKKDKKRADAPAAAAKAKKSSSSKTAKVAKGLKDLSQNPLVADVVAAALVATASALKDSKKARELAVSAGDELEAIARNGVKRGNALWELALAVGRQALDELAAEKKPAKRAGRSPGK